MYRLNPFVSQVNYYLEVFTVQQIICGSLNPFVSQVNYYSAHEYIRQDFSSLNPFVSQVNYYM